MSRTATVSRRTTANWLIDFAVFGGAVIAILSGIYFLYLPVGGRQGGRNPTFGLTILFERSTWDDLHTWGGAAMILATLIHLLYHWGWVMGMARKVGEAARSGRLALSKGGKVNLVVDALLVSGFMVSAATGLHFFFESATGSRSLAVLRPRIPPADPAAWDVVHTWGSVVMILAAIVHFIIHWAWIKKVTVRVATGLLRPQPGAQTLPTTRAS